MDCFFIQIQRSWRSHRLDSRLLVTLCHPWAKSCRVEQLKASNALLKSITINTVRKDDNIFTKTFYWFTKWPFGSPRITNILFWTSKFKMVAFLRCFVYPLAHLITILCCCKPRWFRIWSKRTKILFGSSPPCIIVFHIKVEKLQKYHFFAPSATH